MTTAAVSEGRKTRMTNLPTNSKLPSGYASLIVTRISADTTESNGDWDNHWLNRSTESREPSVLEINPTITFSSFMASDISGYKLVRRFLTGVLITKNQEPETAEVTDANKTSLPNWSNWHSLRQKASQGNLSPYEAEELEMLTEQARILDDMETRQKLANIEPYMRKHSKIISDLSSIAVLLEQRLKKAIGSSMPPGLIE